MLAVSTPDKVSLLDATSGVLQRQLKCAPLHSKPQAMCYVAAKNMLAVSQERNCIFLFDPSSQRPLHKCFMPEPLNCLTASGCGTFLVGGGESGVAYLWLLASGELMQLAKGHLKKVQHVAINAAATQYATASDDGTVRVWGTFSCDNEVVRSMCTFTGHTLAVHSCEFFRWNNWVATASKDRTVRIFDAANGSQIFSSHLRTPLTSLLVSQDDCFLTVGGTEGMLYSIALYPTGSEAAQLDTTASGALQTVAQVEQQQQQAGNVLAATPTEVLLTTQDRVLTIPSFSHGHEKEIVLLSHCQQSDRLITMSADGVALLWENTAAATHGGESASGAAGSNLGSFQPAPKWQVIHELWRAPALAGTASQRFGAAAFVQLQGGVPTTMETLKEVPSSGPLLSKFPSLPGEDGIPVYTVLKPAHVNSASAGPSACNIRDALKGRQKRTRSQAQQLPPMSVLGREQVKKEKLLALANTLYRKLHPLHAVKVKTLTGNTHTIEGLEHHETIADLKLKVEAVEGLSATKQNLMFNGKALDDSVTIEEAKIPVNGATMALMLKV